jgi:hypothetical protein
MGSMNNSEIKLPETYYIPVKVMVKEEYNDKDTVTVVLGDGASGTVSVYTDCLLKLVDIMNEEGLVYGN